MSSIDDLVERWKEENKRQKDAWTDLLINCLRECGVISPEQLFVHQSECPNTTILHTRISCWKEAPCGGQSG